MTGLRLLIGVVLAGLAGGCVIEPFADPIPIAAGYSRAIPLPTSTGGGQAPVVPAMEAPPIALATQPIVIASRPAPIVVDTAIKQQSGAMVLERLMSRYPAAQDKGLSDYLVLVGSALALQVPQTEVDFSFVLLETKEPMSGCVPPSTVYVSRGMLKLMEDESELAGVLAREMTHLLNDRVFRAAGLTMAPAASQPATRPATGPATAPSPMAREVADKIGPIVLGGGMGEEMERVADGEGARLAAKARYAPDGFLRVLLRLKPGTPGTPERARIAALNTETDIVSKAFPGADVKLDVRFKSFVEGK